jgi:hypothetical protein
MSWYGLSAWWGWKYARLGEICKIWHSFTQSTDVTLWRRNMDGTPTLPPPPRLLRWTWTAPEPPPPISNWPSILTQGHNLFFFLFSFHWAILQYCPRILLNIFILFGWTFVLYDTFFRLLILASYMTDSHYIYTDITISLVFFTEHEHSEIFYIQ